MSLALCIVGAVLYCMAFAVFIMAVAERIALPYAMMYEPWTSPGVIGLGIVCALASAACGLASAAV